MGSRPVMLTFDVEDFINDRSTSILEDILEVLDKEELQGLFFITGHVAEKLQQYPELVSKLKYHEVGYHSTGHSVRPLIAEFTDVPDYNRAQEIAFERETSYVSPTTGKLSGVGGIVSLRKLFPEKSITSYRAPGFCWSPPHLEALNSLGITADFSTSLVCGPYAYKNTTFYPFPISLCPPEGLDYNLKALLSCSKSVAIHGTTVLLVHPSTFVNDGNWDAAFIHGNPEQIVPTNPKLPQEQQRLLKGFSVFIKRLGRLKRTGLIEVTTKFSGSTKKLQPTLPMVKGLYARGIEWSVLDFKYDPSYLYSHYLRYFELA